MLGMQRIFGSALLTAALVCATPLPVAPAAPNVAAAQANWGSCLPIVDGAEQAPGAQCAMLTVPIDYDAPGAGVARIAVVRVPATGQRLGALLVNPGGPGASAVDTVVAMGSALAGSPINTHFDLVGFDPRGVGYSQPLLRCLTDAEFDAWRREPMADYSPAGVARIEALNKQYADRCAAKTGTAVLAHVGTREAARDMDEVRKMLGDEQINYLGFSYGTRIGTEYVNRFGPRVRAMVLDGAIDPSAGPLDAILHQMAGFQSAFDDFAADCARSADCPLGTDPSQANARYRQLVDPLVTRPARTADPRGLSYADAITGTFNALYSPQLWRYLTRGLTGLARGTDPGDLLTLADEYQGRDRSGHYTNAQDAFNAIRCVDAPWPTDPAVWAGLDAEVREAAPFAAYGSHTGRAPRDICSFWPVPPTSSPAPATAAEPGQVVVVSTTGDPATPYQAGVSLARQLGGSLVTFQGTQHTAVFNGNECLDTTVLAFLIDGKTPPSGLRCG
ncbi:alpha/beta hydrolase [Mycolicibacterium brumae]|uniref:Alpha/beta hydrolase n=1 Tax=Mycolicibacterium brumae TaxID=85968 RepID=A0A2G5P5T2_9MYCO|nr:alpha/beta hydrolase [Mycolicibacterium brumae]MCV7191248.1 alpha/beta hydrolase [Mycolicibacterium brumae]PIB73721.1 alpha/beta hydrolase [Mycolicibacterium brumae]UWW08314.1 alpha/beta hydrolase [Mycolicibacterium brumae]